MKAYQNTAGLAAGRSAADHLQSVPEQRQPADRSERQGRRDQPSDAGALRCFGIRRIRKKARNDRFNVNFQRQLPGQVVASFTYFFNVGNQQLHDALNNRDPRIDVAQQNAINHDGR